MDRTERDVERRNGKIEKSDKNLRSTKTAAQSTSEPKRRNVVTRGKNVSGRRSKKSTSKKSGVQKSVKSDLSFESVSSQVNNVVESVDFGQHLVETSTNKNDVVDNDHLLSNSVDNSPFEDHVTSTTHSESVEATSSSRRTREKGYPTFEADEHLSFHLLHYQDNEAHDWIDPNYDEKLDDHDDDDEDRFGQLHIVEDVEEADHEIGSTVYNRSQSASSNQLIDGSQPLAEVEGLICPASATTTTPPSNSQSTQNIFLYSTSESIATPSYIEDSVSLAVNKDTTILGPSYNHYSAVADLEAAEEMTSGGENATMQDGGAPNGSTTTGSEDTNGHNGHHHQDHHQQHGHLQQQQHYLNPYFPSTHSTTSGSPTPSGGQSSQLSYYGRAVSQYMQESSPSVSSSSHYIPYGYVAGSGSQQGIGSTGNDESGSHSPTSSASAAALAAYYGSPSFGSAGSAGMASHADYASYYSNYIAAAAGSFYGSSGYGYGSAGSPHVSSGGNAGHLGTTGTSLHGLPTSGNGSHMGSQPIYHLSSLPPPASIAEPGSNSLDEVLKAPGETRKTSNRGRGSKRRNSQSPDPENHVDRVFIWDLDETIILFNSLLTGSFATKYIKDGRILHELAKALETVIYSMSDSTFFYNDLDDCDQVVHVDDLSSDDNGQDLTNYNFDNDGFRTSNATSNDVYLATGGMRGGVDWMRKLAFRFRKIKENYNLFRNDIKRLLGPQETETLLNIRQQIESHTDSWHSLSMKCLNIIQSRPGCVNVIVTQNQLVPALAKIIVYGLGPIFEAENVYCAAKIGKEACFDRIVQRFGRKSTFVVLGDGVDEENAAKCLGIPFWRVSSHTDLVALNNALDMHYI